MPPLLLVAVPRCTPRSCSDAAAVTFMSFYLNRLSVWLRVPSFSAASCSRAWRPLRLTWASTKTPSQDPVMAPSALGTAAFSRPQAGAGVLALQPQPTPIKLNCPPQGGYPTLPPPPLCRGAACMPCAAPCRQSSGPANEPFLCSPPCPALPTKEHLMLHAGRTADTTPALCPHPISTHIS